MSFREIIILIIGIAIGFVAAYGIGEILLRIGSVILINKNEVEKKDSIQ